MRRSTDGIRCISCDKPFYRLDNLYCSEDCRIRNEKRVKESFRKLRARLAKLKAGDSDVQG